MTISEYLTSLPNNWSTYLSEEINKDYFKKIISYLSINYKIKKIFPPIVNIYDALKYTSIDKVKLVIFGQDPYFRLHQANGLAFSLNKGVKLTPSLKNIFKEINNEYGYSIPTCGDLTPLAKQDVLLLNTILTVEEGKPSSHKFLKWDIFTSKIIQEIEKIRNNVVYLLLGNNALSKEKDITHKNNIIYAGHPSPLNTSKDKPFIGSNCFIEVNKLIKKYYNEEINFDLANLE